MFLVNWHFVFMLGFYNCFKQQPFTELEAPDVASSGSCSLNKQDDLRECLR